MQNTRVRALSLKRSNVSTCELTIAQKSNKQHPEKKIKLSQITLYLNSQKQTCAQVVYFNQHLENKIKQNKIMLYMNMQYNYPHYKMYWG